MVKKITWLIVLRIILVTLFMSVGALVFKINKSFFYWQIAAVYFLSLLYLLWLIKRRCLKVLTCVQVVIDALLTTLVVLYTGSMYSVFILLYIIIILCASIIISPVFGMLTTCFVSSLYLGQLFCAFYGLIPFMHVRQPTSDFFLLLYTAHVHIVTFLLVGILAAFLSRKINQMEEKIREKERTSAMGELAAQIAHEIRNPLSAISGSIELLEEALKDRIDTETEKLMKAIVSESERISSVFEQFLDLSKIDSMVFAPASMRDVIKEIVLLLESSGFLKNVELIDEYSHYDGLIECDCGRIKQVLWNIIRNALEAMPLGGVLTIKIITTGDKVRLIFTDTGHGFNHDREKKLIRPFTTAKKTGWGLGLIIAHKIIQKHNGCMYAESSMNQGAEFMVELPQKQLEV
jgi:signal transduction histidine kinase